MVKKPELSANFSSENEYSELRELNKELELFCYAVSHDLRAPLKRAQGYCQVAIDDFELDMQGNAIEYINRAYQTMEDMNGLIDDLLRLSAIQQQALRSENFNISKMAESICEQLNHSYENMADFYICPDITIAADSSLVHILLENLLSNAWKYSQKSNYPRIEFGIDIQKNKTVFYVKDNGVGFDMQYAHKLFTPFQRLHSKSEFEGTGVGLSTVKRIVDRHGGRVWAKSSIGKGTTLYFTLN